MRTIVNIRALSLALAAAVPSFAQYPGQYGFAVAKIKNAMLGSIRTSWEQGTAMHALQELDFPELAVFGSNPFKAANKECRLPTDVLTLAVSAVTRQTPDGRLSQSVNGDSDGAALDGASAGVGVWLGALTDPKRSDYFLTAAQKQLDYILYQVPRTDSGAFSHRAANRQYWADGMFMGPPFLAYAGAVTHNQSLIQLAYDNIRLYRDALIKPGPTGPLLAHIFDDESKQFLDEGLWASGNGWAALGAVNVLATIQKSEFASNMSAQAANLTAWAGEIVNGTFLAANPDGLIPDYIAGNNATFGDASASGALAASYYRLARLTPKQYGPYKTPVLHAAAEKIRNKILSTVDELGLISPVVDPLSWAAVGVVSTEAQGFALMMHAAWRDWVSGAY